MPGNYELYDPTTNKLGSVICKYCWEASGSQNSESLNTAWVSIDGRKMILWLCNQHTAWLGGGETVTKLLKSEPRVYRSPEV